MNVRLRMYKYCYSSEGAIFSPFIRSDEGPTLETSAFESLYGRQFTLSTQLIKSNYLVILPTNAAPQFL